MKETTRTPHATYKRTAAMWRITYAVVLLSVALIAMLGVSGVISFSSFVIYTVSVYIVYMLAIAIDTLYNAIRTLIDTN